MRIKQLAVREVEDQATGGKGGGDQATGGKGGGDQATGGKGGGGYYGREVVIQMSVCSLVFIIFPYLPPPSHTPLTHILPFHTYTPPSSPSHQRVVAQQESIEHSMYRQVKEAEAHKTKKEQALRKLQEDLEGITRENAKQLKVSSRGHPTFDL